MKSRYKITLISGFLLLLMVVHAHEAKAADIAIVVNPGVAVDNLSFVELRNLLLGDRQFWTSNMRITLLIRAPMARERDVVLKNILRMTEAQYRQYWIGKLFRAESTLGPKTVYSNDMAAGLLNSIPGSVAFIDVSQVPKDLKVLRVDGHLPGEKGYPLN